MLTFSKRYFILTLLIFSVEIFIALFVTDGFIRPYLGDLLVVVMIYCFLRSFLHWTVVPTALSVLAFAFTVEFLQYVRIVEKLGWHNSKVARTIIGTSFEWADLLAYTAGIVMVLAVEKYHDAHTQSEG